jgi:opacity protein-like surface antigen
MKPILLIIICLVTFNSAFSQNENDKHPLLKDGFIIGAGMYFPARDVKLGVEGNINTEEIEDLEDIDFDETLGLKQGENTFNLTFMWRFSRNKLWSVRGDYFKVGTTRNVTLDEEIEWNDITYPVGGEARVNYGIGLYRIFFGRAISTGQKHELGGGLGIHGLNVKASVEGEGFIGDQSAGFSRSNVDAFLPLPNVGFWYMWAPTKRWAFSAGLDWFGIKIDNISGGLWNVSPGVSFQIIRNLALTANYQFLNFNANIDESNFNGSFDLTFSGPSFRVIGNF